MNRVVLALLAVAAAAAADIIHVPGQYPTIQQGIDAASAGDIVMVAPGTYVEEINLKAGVVVQGAGEGRSVIDGGGNSGDVVRAIGNAITPDTKVNGFTITGALNGGGMPGGGGVFCNSGARPEITNCRISGNDCGIALWNGSAAYIANNVITDNLYDGVSVGSPATVINNTIHNCRTGFYDYGGYGPTVMNNIITGCSLYGVYGPSGGQGPVLTYNDVWNNAENYRQASPGVGSDSVDPAYADSAARDFHLQAGSPCIDAGNPDPQYNDPDGTRNDIGAYGGPGAVSNLPAITSLVPARNALDVAIPTSALAGFNVPMDPATFSGATFKMYSQLTGWRFGPVTYDSVGHVAELDPDDGLWPGELVTVELTHDIRSAGSDTFPGHTWQFTTAVNGGSGLFAGPDLFRTGSGPNCAIAGDFDADNILDLAVANPGSGSISVLAGNGDGTFDSTGTYVIGAACYALRAADFDNDSVVDIAVTNSTAGSICILLGNGDGTFGAAIPYAAGTNPWGICCGDFDADGNIDVATACADAESVAVLLGNGDGSLAGASTYPVGALPADVLAADCDSDGILDLVVSNRDDASVSVLKGNGDGTFGTAVDFAAGTTPNWLCCGDFDADGDVDLAAANLQVDSISVLLGDGSGSYPARTRYPVVAEPISLAAADFDGDGDLDLVAANSSSHNVSVLSNHGNGAFGAARSFTTGGDPSSVCAGDFDLDDDLDLCVTDYARDKACILLNNDALQVTFVEPDRYAIAAPETTSVSAMFNLGIDPATLDSASFLVRGTRTGLRRGAAGYDSVTHTVWFDPAANFTTGEPVVATLTEGIRGSNGTLLGGFNWTFTTAIPSASGGTFATQSAYPTGSEPRGLTSADFDGDGDVDIVTTCNSPASAALLRNDGSGAFASPSYTGVNGDPIAVFAADFDSDHDVDVAVFHNEPGTSHLEILRNDGSGAFTTYATYTPATLGQYISGADFDGDGDVDIVVTDGWGSQNNVKVLMNNGTGGFGAATSYSAGSWAHGVTALDADNDGDFDIAVCNQGNDNISVLYNNGSGVFSRLANYTVGAGPEAVYANDLNGDGRVDIAVASTSGSAAVVVLNNGSGGFGAPATYTTPTAAHTVEGGDFDGDGDIDLGLASNNGTAAYVLLNGGDGTFGAAASYGAGSGTWTIGTADFNGDGALDLATTNYGTNNVSVMLATGLGVSEHPGLNASRITLDAFPNPFRGSLAITLDHLTAGALEHSLLRIFDTQGRLVRSFGGSEIRNRKSGIVWDGTDSRGRLCPPGVYVVKLVSGGFAAMKKVVLAR